jgi:hypothetical protein
VVKIILCISITPCIKFNPLTEQKGKNLSVKRISRVLITNPLVSCHRNAFPSSLSEKFKCWHVTPKENLIGLLEKNVKKLFFCIIELELKIAAYFFSKKIIYIFFGKK